MKYNLSNPYTRMFQVLVFGLLGFYIVYIFLSPIDIYSFLFLGLILIVGRIDIFLTLKNNIQFDSQFLYVGNKKYQIEDIKGLEDISFLTTSFKTITFKNKEYKKIHVIINKPFKAYIIWDCESIELMVLEKLIKKHTH